MNRAAPTPHAVGQLVWCPADTTLGVGKVTGRDGHHLRVKFPGLQDERVYTTRGEQAVLRYPLEGGEVVAHEDGSQHRVRKVAGENADGVALYVLDDGSAVAEAQLAPVLRDASARDRLTSLDLAHPEVVRARMAGLALGAFGRRPGWAAVLGARAAWLPHQIDVATCALERPDVRLLLADEVGLGKTVEAAMIFAGLRREGRAARVLVLTPDTLCIQWLQELFRKTHELLVLLDAARIDDARRDHPGLNCFEAYPRMVASLPRLAFDPELAGEVTAAHFDLVIVDEAHHLRWRPEDGGNPAYQLVESLAARCRHLLLLTATPMALDPTEYHALLRLLDPARFDDPAAFAAVAERAGQLRTLGRDLAEAVESKQAFSGPLGAALAEVMADDPDDLDAWQRLAALPVEHRRRAVAGRRVVDALRDRHGLTDLIVRNRRGPVGGMPNRVAEVFPLRPTAAQELLLEVGESVMLELAGSLAEAAEVRRVTGELLRALWATPRALTEVLTPYSPELARQLAPHIDAVTGAADDSDGLPTGDARLRWLVAQQRAMAPGDKMLVFVESVIAVAAVADSLDAYLGGHLATFHAEMAPRDQDRQVAWFRDPEGPSLLVSTEAGGEGRNFQFCNKVVLYDLPWRPATVEQRIGRIDRVGQKRDVHVLVPYFAHGYEAAVLKVMQQSIGVLGTTVGGIDHRLEYVSDRLADLVREHAAGDAWKALFLDASETVRQARARINAESDPIVDHASFSPSRVGEVLASAPAGLEANIEAFVQRYAGHTKVDIEPRGPHEVALTGAPAAGGGGDGMRATFSREFALDHEEVEFISFGHPLVEQALEWAESRRDLNASLALCRGYEREGAAFLWCFRVHHPDDCPELAAFAGRPVLLLALDEAGNEVPGLADFLVDPARVLERMDPGPLSASQSRWRRLVDSNFDRAEGHADAQVEALRHQARARLDASVEARGRRLRRALYRAGPDAGGSPALAQLADEQRRLTQAIDNVRAQLTAVIAVRLMRSKAVSI